MTYDKSGLYIDLSHLEAFGENTARTLRPTGTAGGRAAAVRLRKALWEIGRIHDSLALKWSNIPAMPGAVRWLLDNHYLAQREGKTARADFSAQTEGLSRSASGLVITGACAALVRSGFGEVSAQRCECFLRGFQKALILNRAELALFVSGLRYGLIMALQRLCREIDESDTAGDMESAFERVFTSLRYLSTADLSRLIENADYVEQTLRLDPAGVYPQMDEASRDYYRAQVSLAAKRLHTSEYKAAQRALSLAKGEEGIRSHVGWWILRGRLEGGGKPRHGGAYIAANILGTLFFSLLPAFAAHSAAAFFLLLLPISELIKSLLDFALLRAVPPAHIPRLELPGGIPDSGRTLCVISTLLTGAGSGARLAGKMEEYRLANRDCGENLLFALLADLPDTTDDPYPGQEEIVSAAKSAVDALNETYGGGFYLLFRPRVKSPDGRYMGWERKRGALLETMRLIRGGESSLQCLSGSPEKLSGVRFLLTLDSDTELCPGAARELAGAMLHPMNRPVIDRQKGVVTAGHGVISPRMGVNLPSSIQSDFARVFAGQGGGDPYGSACGEVYMDLWESGGFAGKGILDIDAYLACLGERLPENHVLSHDALEGAFLRGGYMSDTELTDSFPSGALSYYKRLERWTRGDWQNLPWLFRRGRALPDIERFRLFDSLRRSLVPVMTFAAICAGFFLPRSGVVVAAAAALISCACQLILTTGETLFQNEELRRVRYHSGVLFGIGGGLVRTVLRLILLPVGACFCLGAILRALWRMGVSRRNMLAWQTAGQSDGVKSGLFRYYLAMWPAALAGLILLFLSPSILGRAAGAIWLLSPLFALLLSLPSGAPGGLGPVDAAYVRECAADTWRYFEEFLTREDSFLPPDNFQYRPPVGLAHRSSPTNIGLALLSCLAAADLDLAPADRCLALIEKTLSTLEKLPKWKGHLLNWYDTRTLQPLKPAYVSTVDSGNLRGCLIALKAGLADYGRADLVRRADALLAPMSFAPLYDEKRRLFYIGWDTERDEPTNSWYDLMSSEARLAGFLAVAMGDVGRRHWRKLSRAQLQSGGYRGMASWTGTMFEYLMPELLLPLYRDSLLYESAAFCLYVQKQRVSGTGRPWGISESAYYSLDPAMNYRYKAHGCAGLALKRGMDGETVISPYSSFLALTVDPRAAVGNLRLLDSLGMRGKYGFWEALDYTSVHGKDGKGAIVRCVMAHHAGMSMVAAANCLLDGVMQRRLMRCPQVRAYASLLQERVPIGGVVLRRKNADVPEKPRPVRPDAWSKSGEGVDFARPDCCLLSNKSYNMLFTSTGLSRPLWGALSPYVSPASPLSREKGMEFYYLSGGEVYPLLPGAGGEGECRWELSTRQGRVCLRRDGLESELSVCLPQEDVGEKREIALRSLRGGLDGELVLRFRPLMARYVDYVNHPAFYGLGISAKVKDGCLVLRRLARGSSPELYMCLAPGQPCRFRLSPGADSGRAGEAIFAGEKELFLTSPLVDAVTPLAPEGGDSVRLRFALCMAHSEEDAVESAARTLAMDSGEGADLPQTAAMLIGLDSPAIGRAFAMLPYLCFPTEPKALGSLKRDALWRFGISGDKPILCMDCLSAGDLDAARELMDAHLFLSGCGCDSDLVFISRDGAAYHKPLNDALTEALWRRGGEVLMDAAGGVHILDDGENPAAVRAAASLLFTPDSPGIPGHTPVSRLPALKRPAFFPPQKKPRYSWDKSGGFSFYVNQSLPQRAWQNILTNGRFGYLASDCGAGHMWYLNSRENQISPWPGLPTAAEGPESLVLRDSGRALSLFAAPDGAACRVTFEPGAAVWEKKQGSVSLSLTAFVPPDTDARVFIIRTHGVSPEARLHWRLDLRMAPEHTDAFCCVTGMQDGMLGAENPRAMAAAKPFYALCSEGIGAFTCDRASALALSYDGKCGLSGESVFAARLPAGERLVLVCGCGEPESLRALCAPGNAEKALNETRAFWARRLGGFALDSGCGELDRLMNGWIAYQALACRIMGRCSLYQSGGAYGFRDQLQDAVNLISLDSSLAREQILRSCAHQYTEGDVQHWWHETGDFPRGVRTRCSDDLIWLPWALCEYVEKTGDRSLCREEVSYIASGELGAEERDRYEEARPCQVRESVASHCVRALEAVIRRGTGRHGLLPIGGGDWNDGFDRVSGESQWLTVFFAETALRFADLLETLGEGKPARYRDAAAALTGAINESWDGAWYRRGYYADGAPLGSAGSHECRIDAISQSAPAFFRFSDLDKVRTALQSAAERLFDREKGLVKLFEPPFAGREHPGYIESYGPGFRENGGQYTHGALWLIAALLRTGETDRAWDMLRAILPAGRDSGIYKAEPFVLAADVYAARGHEGEAGWSWYTGSAGWLYRIVTEELLGLRLRDGRLYIEPRLPASLHGYRAAFAGHRIAVEGGTIKVDGIDYDGGGIIPEIHK